MSLANIRTPLEVFNPSETVDDYGQVNRATPTAGTGTIIFAAIQEATATEQMNHRQLDGVITHKIRMRWHPSVNHRSQFRTVANQAGMISRRWEVVSVVDWQERRMWLDCMCREIVS